MKRLTGLALGILSLVAMGGVAHAVDQPIRQEGRVWVDTNLLLQLSPNWSITTMPGARVEFARTRETKAGLHFVEFFFGPNYTYKTPNLTFKASAWYYYMGYPAVGRNAMAYDAKTDSWPTNCASTNNVTCASNYNFSHNLEIIPSIEYRFGRFSISDRVILHNTFYADVYNKSGYFSSANVPTDKSNSDLRWGWGTVLREMLQVRYAVNDRLGVSVADEIFLGIKEDSDTKNLKKADGVTQAGYSIPGYWKNGFRSNRFYAGIDYKVTPSFIVAPMYMVEMLANPTNSSDITDVSHTLFMVATFAVKLYDDPK